VRLVSAAAQRENPTSIVLCRPRERKYFQGLRGAEQTKKWPEVVPCNK
jgi:hypothetical protein